MHTYIYRQTDRQTQKQKHACIHVYMQTGRHRSRSMHTCIHIYYTDKQIDRHRGKNRQAGRQSKRECSKRMRCRVIESDKKGIEGNEMIFLLLFQTK